MVKEIPELVEGFACLLKDIIFGTFFFIGTLGLLQVAEEDDTIVIRVVGRVRALLSHSPNFL